jgi:hypothetical protein
MTSDMSVLQRLRPQGVPVALLLDLMDPAAMRLALASELLVEDLRRAPAPALPTAEVSRAHTA